MTTGASAFPSMLTSFSAAIAGAPKINNTATALV